jgi:hypothetical protein
MYAARGTCCELAGAGIDSNGLQFDLIVDIDCLQDVVRPVEDDERVAGYVCLPKALLAYVCGAKVLQKVVR